MNTNRMMLANEVLQVLLQSTSSIGCMTVSRCCVAYECGPVVGFACGAGARGLVVSHQNPIVTLTRFVNSSRCLILEVAPLRALASITSFAGATAVGTSYAEPAADLVALRRI